MDEIRIQNLEVYCNHGVFKEENTLGQKFIVSTVLYLDTRKAGLSDELTASIHYGEVAHFITEFMKEHTFKLIETVAEQLAKALLLKWEGLNQVTLEVKKPWAPIGLPLENVSVRITRGWHTAYIALGSNMGDKRGYLENAVMKLNKQADCKVLKTSTFIETKPVGFVEQDDFLNGCLELRTLLVPEELLTLLNKIEEQANRERIIHWGPRTLDLDIIFYDDKVLETSRLVIPHPEMHKRLFVLEPLAEIAPYKLHPLLNKRVIELKENLAGSLE